jgi:hypothetical protein
VVLSRVVRGKAILAETRKRQSEAYAADRIDHDATLSSFSLQFSSLSSFVTASELAALRPLALIKPQLDSMLNDYTTTDLSVLPLHELRELRRRALSANELTDAAATLVGSYTDKLNSVNTSGVIRQAILMSTAVSCGLATYFLLLRPYLAVSNIYLPFVVEFC